ncbi:Electron transport protein SCO1/SenC [Rhodospirillaceae bacterium LM-1]|nr:Electron transport protein SCO1/SenC [Rhodospirillaceae bacterium LM-1]
MGKMKKLPQGLGPVLIFAATLLVALGLGIGIRYLLTGSGAGGIPSPVTIGGPFTLTDPQGKEVTEKSFPGKYLLVYFGYTYCPDVCPTSLGTMAEALGKIGKEKAAKIKPIFISVDPERDTKERLADYGEAFYSGMAALTGTSEQVAAAAKQYRVYFAKVKAEDAEVGYLIDHSALLYLMGPDGKFIRHFSHGTQAAEMAAALEESVK